MARVARLVLALAGSAAAAGSASVDGTTRLSSENFDSFVGDALAAGKTAMAPGWRAAVEHFKDDPGVVFGDVNLREAPVRTAANGTPQNPGSGGWPTLRYFNAETGPGGAVVEQATQGKICDEFKVPARMIEATNTCMRMCNASTGEGCDEDEASYLAAWREKDSAARAAESARLMDLLTVATQKRMNKELKLLAKLNRGDEL